VSELIEQLTALEKRLFREQINLLVAMAKQPGEAPLAVADLSRISDIHSALEAVRTELPRGCRAKDTSLNQAEV
jgi:hypothetical protein